MPAIPQDALAVHVDVESENDSVDLCRCLEKTACVKDSHVAEQAGLDADRHLVLQPEKPPPEILTMTFIVFATAGLWPVQLGCPTVKNWMI